MHGQHDGGSLQAYVAALYRQMQDYHASLVGMSGAIADIQRRLARAEHLVERLASHAGLTPEPQHAAAPPTPTPPAAEPPRAVERPAPVAPVAPVVAASAASPAAAPKPVAEPVRPAEAARPAPIVLVPPNLAHAPIDDLVRTPTPPTAGPVPSRTHTVTPLPERPAPQPPAPRASSPKAPARAGAFEELVGGKLALWAGVGLVCISCALLLAWGWTRISDTGRCLMGAALGAILLGASEALRGRTSRPATEGISACGIVVLYLSAWAATAYYGLMPLSSGFVSMGLITALCVGLSLHYDAVSLMVVALLGGFLTPVTLRGSGPAETSPHYLLGYLAVLNAGVLAASFVKRWRAMNYLAFAMTALWMLGWLNVAWSRSPGTEWMVFGYLTAYFVIFVGIASAYAYRLKCPTASEDVLLLVSLASVYLLAGLSVLPAEPPWDRGVFALALSAWWALLAWSAAVRLREDAPLRITSTALAMCCLTIAFPLLYDGNALVIAWSSQAAALAALAVATRRTTILTGSLCVLVLAIGAMVLAECGPGEPSGTWILDGRGLTFAVLIASAAALTWLAARWGMTGEGKPQDYATGFANATAAIASLLALWFVTREAYDGQAVFAWFEAWPEHATALLALSLALAHGVASVYLGLVTRLPGLRTTGLCVSWAAIAGTLATAVASAGAEWTPFWSIRGAALATAVVAAALLAWAPRRRDETGSEEEADARRPAPYAMAGNLVLLWLVTQETYGAVRVAEFPTVQDWPTAVWLVLALVWMAHSVASTVLGFCWKLPCYRWAGMCTGLVGTMGALAAALASADREWAPFWSIRSAALAGAIAAAALLAWASHHWRSRLTLGEDDTIRPATFAMAGSLVLLWLVTQETYGALRAAQLPSPSDWSEAAWFVLALIWLAHAVASVVLGFLWKLTCYRWTGLCTGLIATVGALAVSSQAMDQGWAPFWNIRAASLAGAIVAAALLAWASYHWRDDLTYEETDAFRPRNFATIGSFVVLWVLTQEVWRVVEVVSAPAGRHWHEAALFAVALVWTAHSTASVFAGFRWGLRRFRAMAVATGVAATIAIPVLAVASGHADWQPFWNIRVAALAGLTAGAVAVAWASHRWREERTRIETGIFRPEHFGTIAGFVLLWLTTQEVYRAIEVARFPSQDHWRHAAQLAVSLVWTVYAALAMGIGIALRRMRFRTIALTILGLTLAKVFFYDFGFLEGGYRVLSFFALGLILIGVAVLYGRYRDVILGAPAEPPGPTPPEP